MRQRLLVRTLALLAGAVLSASSGGAARAASDAVERAACVARGRGPADVGLASHAGADRYDFGWMADRDNFGRKPYIVHVADPESPRSLIEHDRVILPGTPADWIAAARGADLMLCARRVPAVIVIERQFCSGPLSAGDVANGEIEEITFLGGTTWLADDLQSQIDGATLPPELAEDLRSEVAMASPLRHARDPFEPQVISYAPEVAPLVAGWTIVPMSRALGDHAVAAPGCYSRHADLRARIMPTNR
jgi:hypothetical protein